MHQYRASTQAAFWKKDSFLEILRPWESDGILKNLDLKELSIT